MFLAKLLHIGTSTDEVVTRHSGKEVVLNLKVEMSKEPVLEKGILNVAGACQLHGYPVLLLFHVDGHGEVADLSGPHKPVALENPDYKVEPETCPETTQQSGKHEMESEVEGDHPQKILEI